MSKEPEIIFSQYLRENPRISYVEPDDPWLVQKLTSTIEVIFGRRQIERIYRELKKAPFSVETFFDEAFQNTGITPNLSLEQIDKIPREGRLVFVANHPFGLVDGMTLCKIALLARGDFKILINSLLCQDKDLAPYFLPIDFANSKTAIKNNIEVKKAAKRSIEAGVPVLIFPSGMVSTADRGGFGKVRELPWTTFAAKLIKETHADVVPVYFSGGNSRRFHLASHISEPLRMALLLNEVVKRFNKPVVTEVGDPIPWGELEKCESRQDLTDFLYGRVQSLAISPTLSKEQQARTASGFA